MKRKVIISSIALLVVVSTVAMTGCSMFFDLLNNTGLLEQFSSLTIVSVMHLGLNLDVAALSK